MRQISFTFAPTTTTETLVADLAKGDALLHSERSNGTFRKVHFLGEGSEDREMAEYIMALREGNDEEGRAPLTMKQIASKLHTSVPTVRRMINDLLLTREIEDMDQAEIEELLTGGEEVADTMVVTEEGDGDSDTDGNTDSDTDSDTSN